MKTASESGAGTPWSQTYAYDRYGNRRVTAGASHGSNPTLTPQSTVDIDTATNRLAGTKGSNTVAHDAAGNLTADWAGNSFTYDGDNRLVAFNHPTGTDQDTTFAYDGDGRRVRKVVGGADGITTTYVYNVLGQLVAEFGGAASEQSGTRYLTPDHLGSTRVVTDADGDVLIRHDYLPFGEEVGNAYGGRGSVSGYTATRLDGPAQKFTGKERDGESGLDYFQARYYGGAGGRFTSADEPLVDQFADNPQSWNLYVYSRNNPLRFIDPTGRTCVANADGTYTDVDGPRGTCEDALRGDAEEQFDNPSVTVTEEAPLSEDAMNVAEGVSSRLGSGEDVVVGLFKMALFRGRFSFSRKGLLKLGVKEGRNSTKKRNKSNRQEQNEPTLGDALSRGGGSARLKRRISGPLLGKTLPQLRKLANQREDGKPTKEALEARTAIKIFEQRRRLSEKLRSK